MHREKFYMVETKLSKKLLEDHLIDNFLNHNYPTHKGYLLCADEDDRKKDLLTCNICFEDDGFILISDYHAIIEDAIKYHIKLNQHASMNQVEFGYNNDDFIRRKVSARLRFSFTLTQYK